MDQKKDIFWRAFIVYPLLWIFAFAVLYKVVKIQFVEGDELRAKAKKFILSYKTIEAIRGDICDQNGKLISTSVPVYEVRLDFASKGFDYDIFKENLDSLSHCLANLYSDKTWKEYKKELKTVRRTRDRYYLLKREISFQQLEAMKKFPFFRLGKNKGGLIAIQKYKRIKPYGKIAERTIGYAIQNYNVGIEGAYDSDLQGVSGKRLMQRIALNVWKPVNDENEVEPKNGSDIITTIDVNLQDVAQNALRKKLIEHDADHGCAILMEVQTGYIKAIANLKRIDEGVYTETFNYAIGESSEPGSTFKLISMVAAIDDGMVKLDDSVRIGKTTYSGKDMEDSHPVDKIVSAKVAFEESSNVGISKLIYRNYNKDPQRFIDKIYKMKINEPLNLDISGEGKPYIKNTKDKSWSNLSLPWMSIGYEVKMSPLQTLTFYNAIANNGKMVKPLFIKEIRETGKVVKSFGANVINESICSQETLKKVKEMLEGVVEEGTARSLKNTIYKIAGKTGTAQTYQNGGYQKVYKASFVGYFPADNPKYTCIVVINAPSKGEYYGSIIAGPVFKEIADKVYATRLDIRNYITLTRSNDARIPVSKKGCANEIMKLYQVLNLKTLNNNSRSDSTLVNYLANNVYTSNIQDQLKKRIMPNIKGFGLKDAVYFLENAGLNVTVSGKGTVIRQSINPGSRFSKGSKIHIELS
ncbi:MAG: penicillin-binding protein [Bacteroidota bacterium]|nr:penicillin-binding protein [Bacteroidota bacterium]